MTVDFISETTDAKSKWQNVQVLGKKYQQPRILYLGKKKTILPKIKGNKIFSDERILKECVTRKLRECVSLKE